MNRTELIADFRVRIDDRELPYKYREADVISWADEAVIEANRRARLLTDNTATISVVAGTNEYQLPANIIFVRRAKIDSEELPLNETSYKILDEDVAGWESHTGVPTDYFTDMNNFKLNLYPTPESNSTLKLVTIREPVIGETIEIQSRFHYGLTDWMLFRAYSVRNTDKDVRLKAVEHLTLFENEFGKRSSAKDEVFQLRNRPFSGTDGTY